MLPQFVYWFLEDILLILILSFLGFSEILIRIVRRTAFGDYTVDWLLLSAVLGK